MFRILLCDDSAFVLNLFETRLKAQGFEIVGKARDGEEGVQAYKAQRPDLMLLDITMPNKDGRTALKEIMSFDPRAKVLMISAILSDEIKADCLRMGAMGYVSKDSLQTDEKFNEQVTRLIQSLLKRQSA